MRFGANLRDASIGSWQARYCDYALLKSLLLQWSSADASGFTVQPLVGSSEDAHAAFEAALESELCKVSKFYDEQLDQLRMQFETLYALCRPRHSSGSVQSSLRQASLADSNGDLPSLHPSTPAVFVNKLARAALRTRFVECYRAGQRLSSFQSLNVTAFAKIVKKYRKRRAEGARPSRQGVTTTRTNDGVVDDVEARAERLAQREELPHLLEQIERLFSDVFCRGECSRAEARAQLLVRQHEMVVEDWRAFALGWRVGAALLLVCWLVWDLTIDYNAERDTYCSRRSPGYSLWRDPVMHVYQLVGAMVFTCWCWAALVGALRRGRLNYTYLLELGGGGGGGGEEGGTWRMRELVASASKHTVLYCLNLLLFFKIHQGSLLVADHAADHTQLHAANRVLPLLLLLGCGASLVLPWRQRRGALALLFEAVCSPCRQVRHGGCAVGTATSA